MAVCSILWSYTSVPLHDGGQERVDALLVLGAPTLGNGLPSDEQRWRVDEAVREYRRGRAPYILMSGGAVANEYLEAASMAEYAQSRGIPAGVLLEESRSRNTLENLRNSERVLQSRHLRRVEVISSAAHLHRTAVLLAGSPWMWQTHTAPTPGWGWQYKLHQDTEEVLGTVLLRWCGVGATPVLHRARLAEVKFSMGVEVMASLLRWRRQ